MDSTAQVVDSTAKVVDRTIKMMDRPTKIVDSTPERAIMKQYMWIVPSATARWTFLMIENTMPWSLY
ncbi:hypothetical protein ACIQ57_19530 [Lysinibacillus xylanilyticus]|uniref:hypothetical protein n=1 Tax=Lysinibacillus xylanilyticus TaxID=582475 RepID=UPI003818BF87